MENAEQKILIYTSSVSLEYILTIDRDALSAYHPIQWVPSQQQQTSTQQTNIVALVFPLIQFRFYVKDI